MEPDEGYAHENIYTANFVNGMVDGTVQVTFTWYSLEDDEDCTASYIAHEGAPDTDDLYCDICGLHLHMDMNANPIGVPPWNPMDMH